MSTQPKISSFFGKASTLTSSTNPEKVRKPEDNSDDGGKSSSDSENETTMDCFEFDVPDKGTDGSDTDDPRPTRSSRCALPCCSDEAIDPVHPKPDSKQLAKRKQGKQSRSLCSSWFDERRKEFFGVF